MRFAFNLLFFLLFTNTCFAACLDSWTIDSNDQNAIAFCAAVDEANSNWYVPVVKKPKCPPNGPSSKCSPSSIPLPDDQLDALVYTWDDGSYSVDILASGLDSFGRSPLGEIAENEYGDKMRDRDGWGNSDIQWYFTKMRDIENFDHFQQKLLEERPRVRDLINRGVSVVFYIQE